MTRRNRPGAGRPSIPSEERRVHLTIRVAPITVEELARLALPGESTARTIERLVALASQRDDPADRP
jgi:hypothetical protein